MKSGSLRRYYALQAANWPPPWDYRHRIAVRSSRTDDELRQDDLEQARWALERRSDELRDHAREMMLRHKAVITARQGPLQYWRTAKRGWIIGRQNVRFYLNAWKVQREVVRRLEAQR